MIDPKDPKKSPEESDVTDCDVDCENFSDPEEVNDYDVECNDFSDPEEANDYNTVDDLDPIEECGPF